jgi:hypothetical protein
MMIALKTDSNTTPTLEAHYKTPALNPISMMMALIADSNMTPAFELNSIPMMMTLATGSNMTPEFEDHSINLPYSKPYLIMSTEITTLWDTFVGSNMGMAARTAMSEEW